MTIYDNNFYETITDGSERSAKIVVPIVLDYFSEVGIQSIVDVGCGRGVWGREFEKAGCSVIGIDGDYVEHPVIEFVPCDLELGIPDDMIKFDMAVCREVAEHLSTARADSFVANLCSLSDLVLFSAAIPYQTGNGHVNCQWQSYWAKKFWEHGYGAITNIRNDIWNNPLVEPWYKQNILVYMKGNMPGTPPDRLMLDVVHPEIHYWGR